MGSGGPAQARRRARRAAERAKHAQHYKENRAEMAAALTAGATGSTSLALGDRNQAWDAGAAEKSLKPDQFGDAHFWRDGSKPADEISSYKLPFATASGGRLTAVWKGVTAAAGALAGARGGVAIPDSDKAGVRGKVAAYYRKAAAQYDDPNIKPPWDDSAALDPIEMSARLAYAESVVDPDVEYMDRFVFWTGEFMELAASGQCADCGHNAMAHKGGDHMGACSMQGCDCGGFDDGENDNDSDEAAAEEPLTLTLAGPSGEFAITTTTANAEVLKTFMLAFDQNSGALVNVDPATNPRAKGPPAPKKKLVQVAPPVGWGGPLPPVVVDEVLLPQEHRPKERLPSGRHTADTDEFRAPAGERQVTDSSPTRPYPFPGNGEVDLPSEHQPKARVPKRRPGPKAPASTVARPEAQWTATLAPEGKATDDGRIFAPGSITWRELPLSLMGMTKTADGHDGAEVCGRIDKIWRDETTGLIRGSGVFDTGEFGSEIARMVGDGTLRGVSVDIAATKVEIAPRAEVVDAEGNWAERDPEEATEDDPAEEVGLLDLLFGGEDALFVVREGTIGAATVCPFPAFADAAIQLSASLVASVQSEMVWTVTTDAGWQLSRGRSLTASVEEPEYDETDFLDVETEDALTASAAGIAPDAPPASWFQDPKLSQLTAVTVDDDGRVYGHAAAWGTCHIGISGSCTTAPHTATQYAYFHLKEVVCDDGERIECGTITCDTGHADRNLGRTDTVKHYDHTGTAVADIVCGEDEFGIWVAGALRGDISAELARKVRGSVLSGDWRNVNGNLELVALLAVNVPGFPVPRPRALVASGTEEYKVLTLTAAGIHNGSAGISRSEQAMFAALASLASGEWDELAAAARG